MLNVRLHSLILMTIYHTSNNINTIYIYMLLTHMYYNMFEYI